MGAFGFGLFQDDCALDVRDEWQALLASGIDEPEASRRLRETWKETLEDPDEGPVFWLALALAQHARGRLQDDVAARAREVVASGAGLERWREAGPKAPQRRTAALAAVAAQLAAPQAPWKPLKRAFRDGTKWTPGDIVSWSLPSGSAVAFRVLGTEEHAHGTAPVVELLDGDAAAPGPGVRENRFVLFACRYVTNPANNRTRRAAVRRLRPRPPSGRSA
jgi:hypothetical protein